ncbi:type IV secretion protein IcmB [Marinobacter halodurans]|uniref:Type IV secretion protein IcmB n=1 Tax=Marinobacter halodurans TaxID=2528979 RepID=A0ABY1ZM97_9GAMM|nr:type IV secretion protein IcmB [Marinobacter halodurans]TBW57430.1 type IV secretion protein IcmB [Marinobacter halodurans]
MFSFTDRIVDGIDKLLMFAHGAIFKSNPRDFINLLTTDDDWTFVGRDGSLITLLRVRGITSRLYKKQLSDVIHELSECLGRDLIKSGQHHISITFEFDPDEAYNYARRSLLGTQRKARALGFGDLTEAIFEEKARKLAGYCQVENCYLAVTTTPKAVDPHDLPSERKARAESLRNWPETAEAMLCDFAFPQLRTKHNAAVTGLVDNLAYLEALGNSGILLDYLSVRDYLRQCKQLVQPGTSNHWAPRVADDAGFDIRLPETPADLKGRTQDFKMPPPLSHQLFESQPETIGTKYAVLGNRAYYPIAMSMGPTDPKSFDELVSAASGMRVPFRINMTLKSHGLGYDYLNTAMAKTFTWTSTANKKIKVANQALEDYVHNSDGVVAAMYITACTWAPLKPSGKIGGEVNYDLSLLQKRGIELKRILENWGGCQTTDAFNAPIEGTLATQAGLFDQPMGRVMAPPMPDAIGMSPLFRETTSWGPEDGNIILRTETGRFLHYQQTSSRQNAWVTLLVGPMGYSKSTTLNTLNLYYLLTPSAESEVPYLRSLDVGMSSRAVVDAVKSSVGTDQQHIAQYIRLQNTRDYQINPFDTPLGMEYPIPSLKTYLINLVSTVCYTMSSDDKIKGRLPGLVTSVIDEAYKRFASMDNGGDRARVFSRNGNSLVTEKVDEHGIQTDARSSWHEIRDGLMEAGEIRAALIAHRKAMPVLTDLIGIASLPDLRERYPEEIDGVALLDLFARSIKEAGDMFEILQGETRFELGEAKVISLDLEDMVPKDHSEPSLWQASIAFLLGYNILTNEFFFHRDDLEQSPKLYRAYHERRVKHLETSRKRFSMDERQRFSRIASAQSQVDSLIAEGRKNNVDIQIASQLFEHHTEQSIELATTILILGAGNMSPQLAKDTKDRFRLSDSELQAIRSIRPPSSKGAQGFGIFRTRDGEQKHSFLISDGPIYLWLIATEQADRNIRNRMYEIYSKGEALRRLAAKFPGGSIKKEVESRLAAMNDEEADIDGRAGDKLIDDLVDECRTVRL